MIPGARAPRRRALLVILCLLLPALACRGGEPSEAPEPAEPPVPVRVGLTERAISPGESHRYTIEMSQAQALVLELDQVGLDLTLAAEGPGAARLAMDNPRVVHRPEGLTWIARRPGTVTLTVTVVEPPSSTAPGSYRLRLERPRPATREDFAANRGYRRYQAGHEARRGGREPEAGRAFRRAAVELRSAGDERAEAWALHKLGTPSDSRFVDPGLAEAALRRAVEIERRLGGGWSLANALYSLAGTVVQGVPSRPYEAAALFQQARETLESEPAGSPSLALHIALGEASTLERVHRTHAALGRYAQALELARSTGNADFECRALLGIARALRRSGDLPGAIQACTDCREVALATPKIPAAEILTEMASIELDRDRPRAALRYLVEAESASPADGPPDSRRLHDRGRTLARLGRFREAQEAFDRALAAVDRPEAGIAVRIDSAYAHHLAGEHRAAYDLCAEVLDEALETGDALSIAGTRHCMARTLEARGRLTEALDQIRAAVRQVEALRADMAQDRLRALFLGSKREYYELFVRILLDLADREAPGRTPAEWREWAFEVAEASKSRTLLDALYRSEAESGHSAHLLARKRLLEEEIRSLDLLLLTGRGGNTGARSRTDLEDRLQRRHAELDLVRGQMRAERPGWQRALALEPASVGDIRAGLLADGDTQIVSFFLGEEESVVWVLGEDSIVAVRLPRRSIVEPRAEDVARGLAWARAEHEVAQADADAAALADLILEPILDVLDADRLVLVKEGALIEVSFGALRVGRSPDTRYFGDRFDLVEAHSASTALALRQPRPWRPRSNRRVAIVGDAVFQCDDRRLPEASRCSGAEAEAARSGVSDGWSLDLAALPRLPASRTEARAIARLAADRDPLLLLDFDAQAERFLSGDLSAFEIIHVVTHGFSEPAASGLVFSRFDSLGREVDGVVREWQLYDLRLAADLVVLSACGSGRGARLTGEAVSSLSRALLWAGASTVVVSLWDVDDEATRVLMDRFYAEILERGSSPAEALREAQLVVRSEPEWSAPRYWAGFVVQGDWR